MIEYEKIKKLTIALAIIGIVLFVLGAAALGILIGAA